MKKKNVNLHEGLFDRRKFKSFVELEVSFSEAVICILLKSINHYFTLTSFMIYLCKNVMSVKLKFSFLTFISIFQEKFFSNAIYIFFCFIKNFDQEQKHVTFYNFWKRDFSSFLFKHIIYR